MNQKIGFLDKYGGYIGIFLTISIFLLMTGSIIYEEFIDKPNMEVECQKKGYEGVYYNTKYVGWVCVKNTPEGIKEKLLID